MATWDTLKKRATRRYGLLVDREDELLNDALFLDRVNEIFREWAIMSGGWREEFTINLSGSSPLHTLSTRVVNIVENTVRCDYDSSGEYEYELPHRDETLLRTEYGVLETWDAAVPNCFYLQRGVSNSDGMLKLVLFPQSDTAVTNGIKFWAEVTPSEITATSTVLPVQESEEPHLIAGICMALAETEFSRGDAGARARVDLWEQRWAAGKKAYADAIADSRRAGPARVTYVPDGHDYSIYG